LVVSAEDCQSAGFWLGETHWKRVLEDIRHFLGSVARKSHQRDFATWARSFARRAADIEVDLWALGVVLYEGSGRHAVKDTAFESVPLFGGCR